MTEITKKAGIRSAIFIVLVLVSLLNLIGTAMSEVGYIEGPAQTLSVYNCPSTGNVSMPVFLVEFPDMKFDPGHLSASQVNKRLFDEDDKKSFAAFENESSYGSLNITGDVYSYTAKKSIKAYENKDKSFEDLAMEVLLAFDGKVDYSKYDSDNDGFIDAFALNIAGSDEYWYGCQATWWDNPDFEVDGVKPSVYIINDAAPVSWNMEYYNQEMEHEFGHCMGLPDLYKYDADDWEGMKGNAGTELMDEMTGDYSQFSKLMMGWLKDRNVLVCDPEQKGIHKYIIYPTSEKGSCIIIPRKMKALLQDMITDEYFIIQYDKKEGTMSDVTGLGKTGGIRIMHADAEITDDEYGGTSFKYNGYSSYYDKSHNGRRILRLVDPGAGYFNQGAVINDDTKGLLWYDKDGHESVKTGLTIEVRKLTGDKAEIVISGL